MIEFWDIYAEWKAVKNETASIGISRLGITLFQVVIKVNLCCLII